MDLIHAYSHELSIAIVALLALAIAYFVVKAIIKRLKKTAR
jgi:membrane protein DedA with SNARE-associated domain